MESRHRLVWILGLGCVACTSSSVVPAPAGSPGASSKQAPIDQSLDLALHVEQAILPPVVVEGERAEVATLAERMSALKVPGLCVAVFDEAGVVWANGYGLADAETRVKVTVDTLFQAGSISKSIHALAVLAQASNGALALDVPVNELLSHWKLGLLQGEQVGQ